MLTLTNAPPRESLLSTAAPRSCWASGAGGFSCCWLNLPAVLARLACAATGISSSSSLVDGLMWVGGSLLVSDGPSNTGAPPNRRPVKGNVLDLVGDCAMKNDKIGDFEGDKLAGNMRGGVVLPRGVCGSTGEVGEPEELEDVTEAERRRELHWLIAIGSERLMDSWEVEDIVLLRGSGEKDDG